MSILMKTMLICIFLISIATLLSIILYGLCVILFSKPSDVKENQLEFIDNEEDTEYAKPQLKYLSVEQIEDIHSRGHITPEEKIKEWEDLDLCAPGDSPGSASWRCKKFKNCHDCLVDYANQNDEYTSLYYFKNVSFSLKRKEDDNMKNINKRDNNHKMVSEVSPMSSKNKVIIDHAFQACTSGTATEEQELIWKLASAIHSVRMKWSVDEIEDARKILFENDYTVGHN